MQRDEYRERVARLEMFSLVAMNAYIIRGYNKKDIPKEAIATAIEVLRALDKIAKEEKTVDEISKKF